MFHLVLVNQYLPLVLLVLADQNRLLNLSHLMVLRNQLDQRFQLLQLLLVHQHYLVGPATLVFLVYQEFQQVQDRQINLAALLPQNLLLHQECQQNL